MGPIEAAIRARAAERRARLYGRPQAVNIAPKVIATAARRDAVQADVRRRRHRPYGPTKQELRDRIAELEARCNALEEELARAKAIS